MSVMINSTKNKFDRVVKTLGFIPFPYHSIRHHKNIYFIKFTGEKGEWKKAYTLKRRNTQSVERHRPKKRTNWNMKNAQTKEWYEKKTTPNALSYKHSHVHGWAWLNKQARTTQSKPCKRLIDNEWFWRNSELYLVRWWNISIKPPWYEINNTFVYISLFFLDFFFSCWCCWWWCCGCQACSSFHWNASRFAFISNGMAACMMCVCTL